MTERRPRVIIADSDVVIRHLIAASLLLAGFDAVSVPDLREYLDVMAAVGPDVVVVRMTTRSSDAWRTAIYSLRRPGGGLVKVLLIIPATQPEAASCDVCLPADACLTTPFDLAGIIRVVRELTG